MLVILIIYNFYLMSIVVNEEEEKQFGPCDDPEEAGVVFGLEDREASVFRVQEDFGNPRDPLDLVKADHVRLHDMGCLIQL